MDRLLDKPRNTPWLRLRRKILTGLILLAVVFGIWCLGQYGRGDGTGSLVAAVVAFVASAGLVAYDSWFLRKTRTLR